MEADVLVISILIGLMLFLAVISIATILYQKNSKNTRYQKEHPDDWLFHDFNHKKYRAINHFALNCTDIQAAYAWICEQGYKVLSNGIEELPFWEKGVAFFIIEGPNKERIEFCERKQ